MTRVLYIDDNSQDRFMVEEFFADNIYKIKTINGADVAILELKNNKYDLIICDIMMPGKDGLSFMKELKSSIPVILTSGIPAFDSFDVYTGIKNYLGFLLKPITPKSLCSFLENKK